MWENAWTLIKTIVQGYIFTQESSGQNGEQKKAAVVAAAAALIDAIAPQLKVASIFVNLFKFLLPWIVDALVAELNSLGKLNPHTNAPAQIAGVTPDRAAPVNPTV